MFLSAAPISGTFNVEALIQVMTAFVNYIFDPDDGPIKMVLDLITGNQILWVFLGFAICTIGVSLLKRIRGIF